MLHHYPVPASKHNKTVHGTTLLSRRKLRQATKAALKHTTGPLLEVGGPSKHGYMAIDGVRLHNGLIISSIEPTRGASQVVDARNLPYDQKSLGGIIVQASNQNMDYNLRLDMLKEARRKVEPGGIIIASTLLGGELRLAEELGFEVIATTVEKINPRVFTPNIGEFVLTLANLETPTGQILETEPNTLTTKRSP